MQPVDNYLAKFWSFYQE